jgi:hypothetical protein
VLSPQADAVKNGQYGAALMKQGCKVVNIAGYVIDLTLVKGCVRDIPQQAENPTGRIPANDHTAFDVSGKCCPDGRE